MRRLLVTGAALGLVATGVPGVAHASSYLGGCGMVTLRDFEPEDLLNVLGGQNLWGGVVFLAVVPPGIATPVTVTCELKVNGVSQGTVLAATGIGAAASAATLTYTATLGAIVSLCTKVVTSVTEQTCRDATTVRVVPEPVKDVLAVPKHLLDPSLCQVLKAAAPAIKGLGRPDLVDADLASGDVYLRDSDDNGTYDGDDPDLGWDCPPYNTDAPLNISDEAYVAYVVPA